MANHHKTILALDVGGRRIGVALASLHTRLPSPLATLAQGESVLADIQALVDEHQAAGIVVGLPRGLDGQHTAQTVAVEEFVSTLAHKITVPLHWQDEAVTSRQAEAELKARGKPYRKEDIDALSATYILEDFLRDHPGVLS